MSKDKDNDDILEIKHYQKLDNAPIEFDQELFGPEKTVEIGEYDLICLEREQENFRRLQIHLLTEKKMTMEEVHDLQDMKIEYLLLDLINFQAEENQDLNEEIVSLEENKEKVVYRWKTLHDTLEEDYRKKHPKDFKKFTVAQEKKRDKDIKTLLDTVRERKTD